MEKKKKIWTEPKLTALVRRKPEEGILQPCKAELLPLGSSSKYEGCYQVEVEDPTVCPECAAMSIT